MESPLEEENPAKDNPPEAQKVPRLPETEARRDALKGGPKAEVIPIDMAPLQAVLRINLCPWGVDRHEVSAKLPPRYRTIREWDAT
jgi:hypothetical protein